MNILSFIGTLTGRFMIWLFCRKHSMGENGWFWTGMTAFIMFGIGMIFLPLWIWLVNPHAFDETVTITPATSQTASTP